MTGVGRARGPVGSGGFAELAVRSVNHRALDLTIKVRETDAALEPLLRRVFSERLSRGKVDVALQFKRGGAAAHQVAVDEELLDAVLSRLTALSKKYPVVGRVALSDLLVIPQLLSVENGAESLSAEELGDLERLARDAAASLVAMREIEGGRVAAELARRVESLRERLARLAERREEITRGIHASLKERIQTLFAEVSLDSGRLEQEAALAADRSDIAEELHRLEGHLHQFRDLLSGSEEPVGKKLEFLSQEILRELNTVGSKARDLPVTREVLEMKSETEKIREQVQNIE